MIAMTTRSSRRVNASRFEAAQLRRCLWFENLHIWLPFGGSSHHQLHLPNSVLFEIQLDRRLKWPRSDQMNYALV